MNRIPDKESSKTMIQRLRNYIEPVDENWFQNLKSASD